MAAISWASNPSIVGVEQNYVPLGYALFADVGINRNTCYR